jgi:tRNA-(ms[2]io[6]A)-hydroxylase
VSTISASARPADLILPVLAFLRCRTPTPWVEAAIADLDTLLLDHAALELKAAQQAQALIYRYGAREWRGRARLPDEFRSRLVNRLSRLAREELRHFEKVVALIESRGSRYTAIPASRYAAGLHALAARGEPAALVDALIIGAVIEARSCERFFSLVEQPGRLDEELELFYASLLAAEARHFEGYLALARSVGGEAAEDRIDAFLAKDAELLGAPDVELRFLSGVPGLPRDARGERGARRTR